MIRVNPDPNLFSGAAEGEGANDDVLAGFEKREVAADDRLGKLDGQRDRNRRDPILDDGASVFNLQHCGVEPFEGGGDRALGDVETFGVTDGEPSLASGTEPFESLGGALVAIGAELGERQSGSAGREDGTHAFGPLRGWGEPLFRR